MGRCFQFPSGGVAGYSFPVRGTDWPCAEQSRDLTNRGTGTKFIM